MRKISRHAIFYWLMNFSFAMNSISILKKVWNAATSYDFNWGPLHDVLFPVQILAILIPIFLVFARFMRDDFAEMLWHKTAATMLKLLMVLPIPLLLAVLMSFMYGVFDFPAYKFGAAELSVEKSAYMSGLAAASIYVWMCTPILFIFAFQWHRWRASR